MKNLLLIVLILFFYGCSAKDDYVLFNQVQKNTSIIVDDITFEYKIQPHDRVSIIVYKHPELSSTTIGNAQFERGLLVNAQGYLRLPLIKKIHIAGLSQTEAEEKVSDAFRTYLKQPDVQLEIINKRAYVIGEVNRPGEIELTNERLTLLQILAQAGDLKDTANRNSILIMQPKTGNQVNTRIVNLTDLESLKTANLMIKPNDVVYVTPNDMKAFNNNVKEISPIFNLISNVLSPFVSIKFLSQ